MGASAAGLTAAETLRRKGFTGALTMVGEEPRLPYDRPPLSKQILRGRWEPDRVALRRHDALTTLGADWLLGIAATTLDTDVRKLTPSNGSVLAYDGLVIATGVTPRALPAGHELGGVHLLRTIDDALAATSAPGMSLHFVGPTRVEGLEARRGHGCRLAGRPGAVRPGCGGPVRHRHHLNLSAPAWTSLVTCCRRRASSW
ncbi:FAD-dependent oxidoreductase [Streptosporangium sp. NPDC002607]